MVQTQEHAYDVVVVGGGNAALSAAQAARDQGVSVAVLEKAPKAERGGNSALTGHMRFPFTSIDDLVPLMDDVSDEDLKAMHERLPSRTEEVFYTEIMETTSGQADPKLAEILVSRAYPTVQWLRSKGQAWAPTLGALQANVIGFAGRGKSHQERHYAAVERAGIPVHYETAMTNLLTDRAGKVTGLRAIDPNGERVFHAASVVLACGGFESNPEMRAKYLGPGWDAVRMRGVPYNTGDGLTAAIEVGAMAAGSWSSCHASLQDINRPLFSLPSSIVPNLKPWTRYAYPFSVMVNTLGRRFVDEGSDLRGRTYAKMGAAVRAEPGGIAWQIFDAKHRRMGLLEMYDRADATGVRAQTLEDLARKIDVPVETFVTTIRGFNAAIQPGQAVPSNFKLDGVRTRGLNPDKSNFSISIEEPTFEAYGVRCGITFTFGGLMVDPETCQVQHRAGRPIPGLYTAGEMLGGLWYVNYPSGSGMAAGAVFGRIAGQAAAKSAAN